MNETQDLPIGWVEIPFADLFTSPGNDIVDGPFGSNLKASEYVNDGVPIARLQNIDRNRFIPKNIKFVTDDKAEELRRHTFVPDDILMTKLGDPLGKACLAPANIKMGVLVADVVRARVIHQWVDRRFLCYQINSERVIEQFKDQTKGTTRPRVNLTKIRALMARLCPLPEQFRIVEKLEELLSDLDAGVAELNVAQKKLVQYRQSLLKAAVEGALTAEWRTTNQPKETGTQLLERIITKRRARWEAKQLAKFKEQGKASPKDWQSKYPEPVKPDTSDLPELPVGWVWSSIGQCFYVGVGATPSRKEPEYWNGEIPWVSSGEVRFVEITNTKELISRSGLNNSSTQINPIGSVLLGMIGEGKTRGQVAILGVEAANNQNCAAIWVPETDIPPEYVYYWLWSRYEETRRSSSGNNQPALNKSIVEKIPFPLPSLNELLVIVGLVSTSLSLIEDQEAAIKYSLKQSAAQRKKILEAAFAGQLVPQDTNDEPASVLLERIRAEREQHKKQPKIKNPQKSTGMKKSDLDNVRDWIASKPDATTFNFSELSNSLLGDYEALKDSIFQLLAEDKPIIEQVFDRETSALQFKIVKS